MKKSSDTKKGDQMANEVFEALSMTWRRLLIHAPNLMKIQNAAHYATQTGAKRETCEWYALAIKQYFQSEDA